MLLNVDFSCMRNVKNNLNGIYLTVFINWFLKINQQQDFKFTARHTVIGNPKYDENADFLDSGLDSPLKKRFSAGIEFSSQLKTKIGPMRYIFKINKISTENLYIDKQLLDCQISLLYNINY